jgi:hypothetical protein
VRKELPPCTRVRVPPGSHAVQCRSEWVERGPRCLRRGLMPCMRYCRARCVFSPKLGNHNSGFRASAVRSVAGGSSYPDGRWRRPDASTTHTGSTVPRFYSSDDPPWCRVRATHPETVIPSDLLSPRSLRLARKKPPPITNLYDCTARKRQCHQPP